MEQEASVLRTKTQTLEQENDKMLAEVKQLQLQNARNSIKATSTTNTKELEQLKTSVIALEKERDDLKLKMKRVLEDPTDKLPPRVPKVFSDMKTKLQLKVNDCPVHCLRKFVPNISSLKTENDRRAGRRSG